MRIPPFSGKGHSSVSGASTRQPIPAQNLKHPETETCKEMNANSLSSVGFRGNEAVTSQMSISGQLLIERGSTGNRNTAHSAFKNSLRS